MTRPDRQTDPLATIRELALATLSFLFYKVMQTTMHSLAALNARFNKRRAMSWNVLNAETLRPKVVLPAIMVTGPRWNAHAVIAVTGPFDVKRSIELNLEHLQRTAESWTVVVYTFPDQRTVAHIDSIDPPAEESWRAIAVKPGKYSVTLRCYRWLGGLELPEIRLDGGTVIHAETVPADTNAFYDDLASRGGRFYLWLHYYIYTLLRFRQWLPQRFVEREFLPMGNPETEFHYGAIERGGRLRLSFDRVFLARHDVYFTLYRRDSFPVRWYQIVDDEHTTLTAEQDGFYLVRLRRKTTDELPGEPSMHIEELR